jgi:hypothetical protein
MQTAHYFRQKAEQCRRLAASILAPNDLTAVGLNALAVEFDSQAALIEAETSAAKTIGYGADEDRPTPANDGDGTRRN